MNILYWAGLALGFDGQEQKYKRVVNDQIKRQLSFLSPPINTVLVPGGASIAYHLLRDDGTIIADIFDRTDSRVGLGIQAHDEDDALEHLDMVHSILARHLKIIHFFEEAHVWSWNSDTDPVAKPIMLI